MVLMEDPSTADPAVAERNVTRGWPAYVDMPDKDGVMRRLSYEVIDHDDDARRSLSPRMPPPS